MAGSGFKVYLILDIQFSSSASSALEMHSESSCFHVYKVEAGASEIAFKTRETGMVITRSI